MLKFIIFFAGGGGGAKSSVLWSVISFYGDATVYFPKCHFLYSYPRSNTLFRVFTFQSVPLVHSSLELCFASL